MLQTEIALPPADFVRLVGGPDVGTFTAVGRLLVEMLDRHRMLVDGTTLLDVGCGCGRVARHLIDRKIDYVGFDRHPDMIRWCQDNITAANPRFKFDWFDLKSPYTALDGVEGNLPVQDFKFPYQAEQFDNVLLSSVFTHMPIEEVAVYLTELRRVTKPSARIMLSVFFSKIPAYNDPFYANFSFDREKLNWEFAKAGYAAAFIEGSEDSHNWFLLTKRQ